MTELDKSPSEHAGRIHELRTKARRAREHAVRINDAMAAANLNSYAKNLEAEAAKLEADVKEISPEAAKPSGEPSSINATVALKPQEPDKS